MKSIKPLLAGIAAIAAVSTAQADTVVHITGSTAFRGATTAAIKNVLGASVKTSYAGTSGGAGAATYSVIQGTIASVPAAGVVTVKCTWTGSTGGIKSVVQNIDITQTTAPNGWMSISNLTGAAGAEVAVASPSYALDTGTFPAETLKPDVTMEDSAQASTGFTSTTLSETRVGVIVFEWVANNGSPANLNNITPLLAQALVSGGMPLFQFTSNLADTNAVYAMGRDFDSGTRLSELAESGVGVFGSVQQIQPTVSGTAGAAGSSITALKLWPAQTVLGQPFAIGQSGFAGGGALADNLATPGSPTAATPAGADGVLFGPGHLVAYLGRNDASRACKTTSIAGNTAHRLTWNGVADWNGPILANGTPTSYNDAAVTNGTYTLWEYESLAYRSTYGGNGKAVADKIANEIINTTATVSGTSLSSMNVSRAVEGGAVTAL